MVRIIILCFAVNFVCGQLRAQSLESAGIRVLAGGDVNIHYLPNQGPEGTTSLSRLSPYLYQEDKPGAVFMNENKLRAVEKISFNLQTQDVKALVNGRILYYDPQMIKGFAVEDGDHKRIFIRVNPINSPKPKFYEVFLSDQFTLLMDYEYTFVKGNYTPSLGVGKPDAYKIKETIYLVRDEKFFEVKKNQQAVLALVSPHQQAIQAYAKKHGLGFRSTADIILLLNEYNALLSAGN